jgi:N-acetyl-anhydromuramyl-L-alanine amidase AmpD
VRAIAKHIVHCSDSGFGDAKTIREWHLERGWNDIGYHYVIRRDGEVEVGRTLEVIGAHCQGHNADSVGTCLVGIADFAPCQFEALKRIHAMLRQMFPGLKIYGHREFNPGKTCPNFDVHRILGE